MAEYIDKDALVAEIDERIKTWKEYYDEMHDAECHELASGAYLRMCELKDFKKFLDTLEVKEVDLENSVKGRIDYPLIGVDFPNIYPNYKELKDYCDKNGIKDEDKVKIIIIKD